MRSMTTIETSILINASVEAVVELLDDSKRISMWSAGVASNDADPGYPAEKGSVNRLTYKAAGISLDTSLTTLEYDQYRLRKFELKGMMNGITTWVLEKEGDATRLTTTVEYYMPGGGLGKIAVRLLVERANERNLKASLTNLKERVEEQRTLDS